MSGPALSKRQQARNEKVLQDLVQSVPGNNFCADCQARNPSWASWSLGIFLCMRCAAIHRKLGTHITKVKSLSMDSWSNEQVENMRKVGNIASNKNYNPQNKRPSMPVDTDEADGAMERFIRQKYISRAFGSTKAHNTGSTESDETPPPLPPKTPSRFGFRSASSIFPLGSKAKSQAANQAPPSPRNLTSQTSPRWNKQASTFGVSVGEESTESKLAKLRDMGFVDEQKNAMILRGVGGDLEKTVEALVRLGERERRSPNLLGPTREQSTSTNRSLTPATSTSGRDSARPRPISPASTNPFDMLDAPPPPQPLSSQSTGTLQNRNPYLSSSPNSYGAISQPAQGHLDMAFQNMSLAPPSQPLFPNHTGGVAPQQMTAQALYQQQPMTAPIPSMGQSYSPMGPFQHSQTFPLPTQPTGANYNPFVNQQAQVQPQQPLMVNTTSYSNNFGNNPFTRSPTRIQSPGLTQIPEQAQPNFYAPAAQPPAQAPPQMNNPFFAPQQQQQQQQQQFPVQMPQQQMGQAQMGFPQQLPGQYQQQPSNYQQQPMYQQAQRPDKASILALYNYPQLAPTPPQAQDPNQPTQQPDPFTAATSASATLAPGSKNPFMNMSAGNGAVPAPTAPTAQPSLVDASVPKQYNASRESVMALGFEWSNGRHSPDAFASLSARDTR